MFDPNVDLLGDDAIPDSFVDNNPQRVFRYVEHATSLSVIVLKGHSLLESTVAFDVNDISSFVDFEKCGQMFDAVSLELTGEHISGSPTYTLWIRHSVRQSDD